MRRLLLFIIVTLIATVIVFVQLVALIISENQTAELIVYPRHGSNSFYHGFLHNNMQNIMVIKGSYSVEFDDNHTTTTLPPATTVRPIGNSYPFQHAKCFVQLYEVFLTRNPLLYTKHTSKSDQQCKFPILNPYDRSITQFIKHPKPLRCRKVQPYLTYVRSNTVHIDRAACDKFRVRNLKYRTFDHSPGNDSTLRFGEWMPLDEVDSETSYYVQARYYDLSVGNERNYSTIYANVMSYPPPAERKLPNKLNTEPKINVFVLSIDSTSRSNFIRNMPKTYKVLTTLLGGWDMRGYTRVDDSTFVNVIAVLTGYRITVGNSELPVDVQNKFVDEWPFIWHNFSAQQYTTLLSEEQPNGFSCKSKGFHNPPTDVYLKPFGNMMTYSELYKISTPQCYGNEPESLHFLSTIKRFIQVHRDWPHFIFAFLSKFSRDSINQIETLDEHLSAYFEELVISGLLLNTIVIVMSDHGNRFDPIRSTLVGSVEERMPFMFMHLPASFTARHNRLPQIMNENVWRLTCQFDVYETLVDVLKRNYGTERETLFNRGISLFRSVPLNRTCDDAGIPLRFCVCQQEEIIAVTNPLIKQAADIVVDTIQKVDEKHSRQRRLLQALSNYSTQCALIELDSVQSSYRISFNDNVTHALRYNWHNEHSDLNVTARVSYLRVVLRTTPGQAAFEALVEVRYADDEDEKPSLYTQLADIYRINSYTHVNNCISSIDRDIEKYCHCKAP